jgi:NAD kinase
VDAAKIVFNGAEMAIYTVYCSRNVGCLWRADGLLNPSGSACYALEPMASAASPRAISFSITFICGRWFYVQIPFFLKKHFVSNIEVFILGP